jgi:hypothetical protein
MADHSIERHDVHLCLERAVRELNNLVRQARILDLDVTLEEQTDHQLGPYRVPMRWWELSVSHRLGRPLEAVLEDGMLPHLPSADEAANARD